ncbi:MAG: hypothetical protein A3E01_04960 [Gammaproteobacteria bacterium RIFCSPHIGHO2_12_FULL_63_22]|nr:MAG: hypothetical protein A3E01_04960 [Gammaproteobacteria bacterium RIFCSPHIGHO2_12_FULL_63_22]
MIARVCLTVALLLATSANAQDATTPDAPTSAATLSSKRDYSDNAQRDLPVTCKEGDLERQAGKTMGQVFGADWPIQPTPSAPDSHSPADATSMGKMVWPRGLEGQRGLVVLAVLVGSDGKPLRAEPLCATANGYDRSAQRSAMGGTYKPALVDGTPITSPAIVVVSYQGSIKRRNRRTDATD